MYPYSCTNYSVTGYSPYFTLFGRDPKLQFDIILREHQEPSNEQPNYHNFIQTWKAKTWRQGTSEKFNREGGTW